MAFDYSEFCVLWTYRNAKPDQYAPTSADLDGWDTELGGVYEEKLVAIMTELGIALTRENKSRIVAYAEVSNGSVAGTRLRNGAKFFLATKDLDLDV